MIYLGDRLQLYDAMARLGPAEAEDIASEAALQPRWVLEWLLGQSCAGIVRYNGDGRFELPSEVAAVLIRDDSAPANRAGIFASIGAQRLDLAERAFRTGEVDVDELCGVDCVDAADRARAPWVCGFFGDVVISSIPGLREKLTAGAVVADLCCGAGLAAVEIAATFPDVHVHAYDTSEHAISVLATRVHERGLGNVSIHRKDVLLLHEDSPFDVVLTLDCMHEMHDPSAVANAVAASLAPDGVWLIEDFRSYDSLAKKSSARAAANTHIREFRALLSCAQPSRC